jgi:hypothetical protein
MWAIRWLPPPGIHLRYWLGSHAVLKPASHCALKHAILQT